MADGKCGCPCLSSAEASCSCQGCENASSRTFRHKSKSRKQRRNIKQSKLDGNCQNSVKFPPPRKQINCNLDRFLESTRPVVPAQSLPRSCQWDACHKRQQYGDAEPVPYFNLGDLWESLDEWSAFGAGVPITLHGQEIVVQYYVPYISALQLYTRFKKRPTLKLRCLEDSDFDEYMDSLSEVSSDSEWNEVPDCRSCQCGFSCREEARNDCACDKFDEARDALTDLENEENSRDWKGHLFFEFLESSPPQNRVPLADKISQLVADGVPELRSLRSVDLLPASWMSIAWYPIYRIPIGPTLQDLEACFLTYHCLSTSLQDGEPWGIVKPSRRPTACESPASSQSEDPTIQLEAFGLAHYKLRGSIWTSAGNPERRHAASMYRCTESWLKRLHVFHPDFQFFKSHNPES